MQGRARGAADRTRGAQQQQQQRWRPPAGGWRRAATAALAGVAALALPAALAAQDDAGGIRLRFGFDNRIEGHSNARFDPGSEEGSLEAVSRLSFGLSSETRAARIALEGGAQLRQTLDGVSDLDDGLANPSLRLSYARQGAGSAAEGGVFWRETDLARDAAVEDFDRPAGTRSDLGGNLALRWGEGGPVGFGLSAGYTDSHFSGGATEPDRWRMNLGTSLRLDLDAARTLTFGLSQRRFDDTEDDPRDTLRLDAGLAIARPDGGLTLALRLEDTPEGNRAGLTAGRRLDLPDGGLALALGVTQGASGDPQLTGSLSWERELPRGSISAAISRDVTSGTEDDSERRITAARLGLSQALTAQTSLSVGLSLSQSVATAGDDEITNASASATLSRALPQDWSLNAGISHRSRDETAEGTTRDTVLFLGLSRSFERAY